MHDKPADRSVAFEALEYRKLMSAAPVSQINLVSDGAVTATTVDANLVNPWGLSIGPSGVLWVSDNGKGVSTAYTGSGQPISYVVSIPTPSGTGTSLPTGTVANNDSAFNVSENGTSSPSSFLFSTIDGTIAGWSPSVDFTHAITAVNNSASGASYTGLAIAGTGAKLHLYAADFAKGTIDVFDSSFQSVVPAGGFKDANLPAGYSPFNVQTLEGKIYVMYDKVDPTTKQEVHAVGLGVVDVFGKGGRLQERLATGGTLDAPWGVAIAPTTWKNPIANKILVGNFGNGTISAFNRKGKILGQLENAQSQPMVIDGLWALTDGVAGTSDQNTLFFTAGPNGEADGLLGTLSM